MARNVFAASGNADAGEVELGRWAMSNGLKKLLFLSGHGTNDAPLRSAILQLSYEFPQGRFTTMGLWDISPRVRALYLRDGEDIHANRGETSILLHLQPEMVRMEHAFDVPDVTPGTHFSYAMPATTPTGVVGRPSEGSVEDGAMMVESLPISRIGSKRPWPRIGQYCRKDPRRLERSLRAPDLAISQHSGLN